MIKSSNRLIAVERNTRFKERHSKNAWATPRWFDLLKQVIKAEPVVVRGAFGFGLKAVAKAMSEHGLIEIKWDSGPGDGLGAMVGAWSCAEEANKKGCILPDIDLMKGITQYNEVDCKAMWEIVNYIRSYH